MSTLKIVCGALVALWVTAVHAQTNVPAGDYPNRPIRLITPAQPGGTTDILAARERIVADGSEPVGSDPESFRKYLQADLVKWAKLVKESGAKRD